MACKRKEEDKVLYKYNAILLPQLYQTELLFRSLDQMGHQRIDKKYQRILKRFVETSPHVYVRDVIRRQQELNDLCRQNTQQAQARQRKRFDKKAAGAKAYSVGDYVWVFQNMIPPRGNKKLLKSGRDRS